MTRSWSFSLTDPTKWYSLWNDLIAPTITDKTFGNSPFVPSTVCEIEYQNQTPGAIIEKSDSRKQAGFQLTGGSWDVNRSNRNDIDLKNVYFKPDTNPTVIYVSITAN